MQKRYATYELKICFPRYSGKIDDAIFKRVPYKLRIIIDTPEYFDERSFISLKSE